MFLLKALLLLLIAGIAWSIPADEKNEESAHAPKEQKTTGAKHTSYLKEFGDQDSKSNDRGYHRSSEDQGNDGYKHFDSFHKKNSDKYGYEHHSAFGKSKKTKNRSGASNAKYDDEEPHEASASRRVFHFSSPWSSGRPLPHIIGFDIEALASKFNHRGHHHEYAVDHHPGFYHDHHSDHIENIEYDHPPPSGGHKHLEEFGHPPIHHHSHKPPSHVPEELDHPPSGYEHEDNHHGNSPKELDHPPPGYGYKDEHHGDSPPDHDDAKELDHPPPGFAHGDKHNEELPPDHYDGKELDHPPRGFEYEDKHHEELPADPHDAKELDHPPPDFEHGDEHHGYSSSHHADAKELDHPPPGYDYEGTHQTGAKEVDHPSPDYGNHHNEKPPLDDSDAKELDQPPPGYETDGQNDVPPGVPEADDRKLNLQPQSGDKNLLPPNTNYHPNLVSGHGRVSLVPPNPTQFPVSNQQSSEDKNFPIPVQNGVNNLEFTHSQPQPNNGDVLKSNQANSGILPNGKVDDSSSSSVISTQTNKGEISQNNTNFEAPDSKNQFGSSQSTGSISSNRTYLPPSVEPNSNYRIFFGGLTNYSYPKPYYDVDHWERTLQNLKSNASSSSPSEVATAANATEQKETTGELIKGTQSGDMLKDSYGNRYIPIDLKKYLPPLPKSNSVGENSNPEISGNDGIFYGEHYIPEEYFGGKFEQDTIGKNEGGSEKDSDDLNGGKIGGEVVKDVENGNMGEEAGNNIGQISGEVVNDVENEKMGEDAENNVGQIENSSVGKEMENNDGLYFDGPFKLNKKVLDNIPGDTTGDKVKDTNVASMKAMKDSFAKAFYPIMQNYYLPPYEINNIILSPTKSTIKSNGTLEGFNEVFEKSGSQDGASVKDTSVAGSKVDDKKSHNHEGGS